VSAARITGDEYQTPLLLNSFDNGGKKAPVTDSFLANLPLSHIEQYSLLLLNGCILENTNAYVLFMHLGRAAEVVCSEGFPVIEAIIMMHSNILCDIIDNDMGNGTSVAQWQ
jgi:hypothetical protein